MLEEMKVRITMEGEDLKVLDTMASIISNSMPGMNPGGAGAHGPGTRMSLFMEVDPERLEKLWDSLLRKIFARRAAKEATCECGPRKSCPTCTKNPNPICPCGAIYNFTCYCGPAIRKAFQAGREWQKGNS